MMIKPIDNKDITEVRCLMEKLYLELGEEKESIQFLDNQLIQNLLSNNRTIILKAVDNENNIIGLLSLTESQAIYSGGNFGAIDDMYVIPKFRSKGIGAKMLDHVKEIAKEKKWKRINVTAPTENNKYTIQFYNQNGFVFTGPKMKYKIL